MKKILISLAVLISLNLSAVEQSYKCDDIFYDTLFFKGFNPAYLAEEALTFVSVIAKAKNWSSEIKTRKIDYSDEEEVRTLIIFAAVTKAVRAQNECEKKLKK
jgi:hypothetical protein